MGVPRSTAARTGLVTFDSIPGTTSRRALALVSHVPGTASTNTSLQSTRAAAVPAPPNGAAVRSTGTITASAIDAALARRVTTHRRKKQDETPATPDATHSAHPPTQWAPANVPPHNGIPNRAARRDWAPSR